MQKIERRDFIRKSALFGAAAMIGTKGFSEGWNGFSKVDVAVVQGSNFLNNTFKAVEMLGGMKKIVSPGSKVGLLINAPAWWNKPGSFTNPELVLATIKMCIDAGAGEIVYVINPATDYFNRTPKSGDLQKEIQFVKPNPGKWVTKDIPQGKSLKKAEINQTLFDCDVIINLPISKHHAGTNFSGNLKNMMGSTNHSTNQFFHKGSGASGDYDDVKFLSQCIADLNTVKKPVLSICDSTEFLLNNGPAGPGEIKKENKVVAGFDCVAVDSYCCTLHGLQPDQVQMIQFAHDHGIGQMDLKKLVIKEING